MKSGWLYDSIEKGFCQDEKKYPVDSSDNNSRNMKTSTPERRSMAGKCNICNGILLRGEVVGFTLKLFS